MIEFIKNYLIEKNIIKSKKDLNNVFGFIKPGFQFSIDEIVNFSESEFRNMNNLSPDFEKIETNHIVTDILKVTNQENSDWFWWRIVTNHGFFQFGFDKNEKINECRYFQLGQQIFPSVTEYSPNNINNPESFEFWLDDNQGVIGYQHFQSPNDHLWYRSWIKPGIQRINPFVFMCDSYTQNKHMFNHTAMLYNNVIKNAVSLNEEYAYVAMIEDDINKIYCIEVYYGFDIDPNSLGFLK